MADPYIGEIRMMSFGYAPKFWAMCNGQIMSTAQNQALFSLLGTAFGGDGISTFALPNLQGNVPIHVGNNYGLGQTGGEPNHMLTTAEIPSHTHVPQASDTAAATNIPNNTTVLAQADFPLYLAPTKTGAMNPATIGNVGGAPHSNMQPYLALNFCIALSGIYPSKN